MTQQNMVQAFRWAARIMTAMDWGEATDFVRFGAVGGEHVDECEYYILIAPQNVVGNTIMTDLGEMVRAHALCILGCVCDATTEGGLYRI